MNSLSGEDVKKYLFTLWPGILAVAGAMDFSDGMTIAALLDQAPEEFMTMSRKRTPARQTAVALVRVAKALQELEFTLPAGSTATSPFKAKAVSIASPEVAGSETNTVEPAVPALPVANLSVVQTKKRGPASIATVAARTKAAGGAPVYQHIAEAMGPVLLAPFKEAWNHPLCRIMRVFYAILWGSVGNLLPKMLIWGPLGFGLFLAVLLCTEPAAAADCIWLIMTSLPTAAGTVLKDIVRELAHKMVAVLRSRRDTSHCAYSPPEDSSTSATTQATAVPAHQPHDHSPTDMPTTICVGLLGALVGMKWGGH